MLGDAFVANQLMAVGAGDSCLTSMVQVSKALKESGRVDAGIKFMGDIEIRHCEERLHKKMQHVLRAELPPTFPITLTTKNAAGSNEPMTSA